MSSTRRPSRLTRTVIWPSMAGWLVIGLALSTAVLGEEPPTTPMPPLPARPSTPASPPPPAAPFAPRQSPPAQDNAPKVELPGEFRFALPADAFRATRTDLARAYMRCEGLVLAHTWASPIERARVHREFDALAANYFGGALGLATARLNMLAAELSAPQPGAAAPDGPTTPAAPAELIRLGCDVPAPADIAARREALLARLGAARGTHPELSREIDSAQSRARLLVEEINENVTIQILTDRAALLQSVESEAAALEAGRNPYRRRVGSLWRTLTAASPGKAAVEIPLRVYAPAQASFERRPPLPVVIALHGAGADENMFMESYGRGLITRLADEHGFLVAAPETTRFSASGRAGLEALLAMLGDDYGIDESRVYVIGHSMGAGAAALLASTCADAVAGAVSLAGGPQAVARGPMAPLLVIGAELDTMIPAARLEAVAKRAIAAGQPIEYRTAEGMGHILMVGEMLPGAIDWLLAKHREAQPKR